MASNEFIRKRKTQISQAKPSKLVPIDEEKDKNEIEINLFLTEPEKNSYVLTRIILVRFIAFLYSVAFLIAFNQNKYLIGKNGLKPANIYMERLSKELVKQLKQDKIYELFGKNIAFFFKCPTIFWFFDWKNNIDNLLMISSSLGNFGLH